jgi:hypothetical protein
MRNPARVKGNAEAILKLALMVLRPRARKRWQRAKSVLREWSVARKFAGFASESPILHRKVAKACLWRIDTVAVKRPNIRETRCDYEL